MTNYFLHWTGIWWLCNTQFKHGFIQSTSFQQYTIVWEDFKKTYDIIFRNNKKHPARFSVYYCSTLVVLCLSMCTTVICARQLLLEKSVIPVVKKKWVHKLETWLQGDLGKISKTKWFSTFAPLLSEYLNAFCKWNFTTLEH